jgi:alkaline phosphatase
MKKYIKSFLALIIIFLLVLSAVLTTIILNKNTPADTAVSPPKYIFLFIGDGFSYAQINLASLYKTSILKEDDLILKSFKIIGSVNTENTPSLIAESAGAVSAIASGIKTNNESLNVDLNGKKYETIAEKLKKQLGYKIGIISSDNLNHATPAGFYAHQESRYNTTNVILELAESGFDYFGGSDIVGKGAVADTVGKPFIDFLSDKDYKYINTREDIENLKSSATDGKVIAVSPNLDPYAIIPYAIDKEKYAKTFTLAEHTKKCAEFLSDYTKNGFFIMVEGGKIDWACHSNDAATMIYEVIDFDNAIKEAVDFYNKNPEETLIIVTGDHETGGLSIGYSETYIYLYLNHLANQKISFSEFSLKMYGYRANEIPFEEVLLEIQEYFGIRPYDGENPNFYLSNTDVEKLRAAYDMSMIEPSIRAFSMSEYVAYGFYDPLTTTIVKMTNQKAGISWGTFSHSAMPVPVFAMGNGGDNFMGFYNGTEFFVKLKELMGLK